MFVSVEFIITAKHNRYFFFSLILTAAARAYDERVLAAGRPFPMHGGSTNQRRQRPVCNRIRSSTLSAGYGLLPGEGLHAQPLPCTSLPSDLWLRRRRLLQTGPGTSWSTLVSSSDCYPRYRLGSVHRPRRGQRARRAGGLVDGAVSIWCLLALSPGSGSGPAAHHYWSLPRRLRIGLDGDERGTQSRGKARFPSTILPAKARDLTATARRLRPLRLAAGDRIQGRAAMARC